MLLNRQNRLLPILGIAIGLLFLAVLQRACSHVETDAVLLNDVPQVSTPDADTPIDTLNTLTANVAAMTAELRQLRSDNAELRDNNQSLVAARQANEQRLNEQVAEAFAQYHQGATDDGAIAELQRRIDEISAKVTSPDYSDLPVGFGLRSDESAAGFVWIEPLESGSNRRANSIDSKTIAAPEKGTAAQASAKAFTVPRNATLMGTTAMTALLGRVPVRGEVRDPMPFKLITGPDNLAANGFKVPGVAGMIWSGTAIGDWTLSCVSGRLHSVTYVFADGSIKTLSSDENGAPQRNSQQSLGWISDDHGVPCIGGTRKSNAAAFLTQRIGAKAVEAAAEAAAASQSTTVIRNSGSISSAVDGSTTDFVLGKTLANSGAEIAAWLAERQAQNFDAIYVPAGASLVIHVDRELAIDIDPQARKIDYANSTLGSSQHRLD